MEFFTESDNNLNLLFWLNERSNSIHRSVIPGVKVNGVVKHTDTITLNKKRKPERAITVDWVHNLLYFFEKDSQDKNRYNLVVSSVDGRYPRTLLHQKFEDPRDVVVDPINGLVTASLSAFMIFYDYDNNKINNNNNRPVFAILYLSNLYFVIINLRFPKAWCSNTIGFRLMGNVFN